MRFGGRTPTRQGLSWRYWEMVLRNCRDFSLSTVERSSLMAYIERRRGPGVGLTYRVTYKAGALDALVDRRDGSLPSIGDEGILDTL